MRKLIFLSILFLPIFLLAAEEPEIRIFANKERVAVNELFKINVQVMGSSQDIDLEETPTMQGLTLSLTSNATSLQMVNGRVSKSITYGFTARLSVVGSHEIGPFRIRVKDQTFLSDLITMEVVESKEELVEQLDSAGSENYILKMTVSKNSVYVNEYVDVIVRLYHAVRLEQIAYNPVSFPTSTWVEDSGGNIQYLGQVRMNGTVYREYEMERKRIYIPNPGNYKVEPAVFDFYGFRTNDIFAEPEQLRIKSEEAELVVKPLPELSAIGQKLSYKGAVGKFRLSSDISRTSLKVKDSVTLKLDLEGEGNFYNIESIGASHNSLVEEYSSKSELKQIGSNESRKSWEILLVPNEVGRFEVKVEDFTYFDIEKEEYVTLKGDLYNIDVASADGKIEQNVIVRPDKKKRDEQEVRPHFDDISYIKTRATKGASLFDFKIAQQIFLFSYLGLFLVIVLFMLYRFIMVYRENRGEGQKPALKLFNSELNSLHKDSVKLGAEQLADEISRIIERYISRKFRIDLIKFTSKGIKSQLSGLVSEEELSRLKDIITQLDMVRFGGMGIDQESLNSLLAEIKSIVKIIDEQKV